MIGRWYRGQQTIRSLRESVGDDKASNSTTDNDVVIARENMGIDVVGVQVQSAAAQEKDTQEKHPKCEHVHPEGNPS